MRRRWAVVVAAFVMATACAGDGPAPVAPAAPDDGLVDIGAGLQGPAGLNATVYTEGLATMSAFAIDGLGRLWVATADYEDRGQDGVYLVTKAGAAPVRVVTGLHTPLGLLWHEDRLYVASTGRVDAYGGFDGGRFTERQTVVTLPDGVGQSNGIALGPDGRMVMGISAPCDACTPASAWSATVVSFRPDGSDRRVEAIGIRAAVGLTYYPGTDDLFVTMNHRDDLEDRTPGDWLAVVRSGQAWGFPECWGQGGASCSGVPAPVAVLDKHAAVSGVAIVAGQLGATLGATLGTAAIVAEWATGKVQRVALSRAGDTWTGSVSPFLTGLENPVPVLLSPDGSLLVGDWGTGTAYRIAPL